MHEKIPVTVLIFTLNEELNLPNCLESVRNFDQVIVVDSISSDGTKEICTQYGIEMFQHEFEGFGSQRNWAIDNTVPKHDWLLILDADERVPQELGEEIRDIVVKDNGSIAAYQVARRFHLWGKWLRYSSLYPTYVVRLIRRGKVRFENRGHAETQVVEGEVGTFCTDLIDENMKDIDDWFERQNRYSTQEAIYELSDTSRASVSKLMFGTGLERRSNLKQIARALPFRPVLYFLYSYILRLGFLDGKDGYVFCKMKATYQSMIISKKHSLRRIHSKNRRSWSN